MAAGCGVRQKCAIFLATLALASLCHIAIAQLEKSLEATQVLNRFEAGVSALKRFRCSGSVRIFAADKGAEPALCETDEFSIVGDREGKRLRTNEKCVYEPSLAKTRGLHDYHVERMRQKGKYFCAETRNNVVSVVGSELAPSEEEFEHLVCALYYSVLFGRLEGAGYLPETLRSMKLQTRLDTIDGKKVDVLSGVSKDLSLTLWLDPQCNYAARRIVLEKPRERAQFGEVFMCQYDAKSLKQQGGTFVPISYRIANTTARGALPESQVIHGFRIRRDRTTPLSDIASVFEVTVRTLEVNPELSDSDFEPQTHVANGTRVLMADAPYLNYIWQDGKPVPGMSPQALAAARGARFAGASSSSRRWLVILTLGALAIVLIVLLYRRVMARIAPR